MQTVNDAPAGTKPRGILAREDAASAAGTFRPCRDYDPNFKLHGCELGAGHDGLAAPHGLGQGLALVAALADACGADGCNRWFALRVGGAR